MKRIKRVAVLGSGVMGAGIAAHLANCGITSLMLDMTADLAAKNKKALLKSKPAALYKKSNLDLIDTGSFDDDMPRIAECDWIVEVVLEKLEIKEQIFASVAEHRTPGTLVSSNTSGIPIKAMAKSMPEEMSQHFLGTHFFNPPRYLKLLELIPGPNTLPEVIEQIAEFGENVLGKGIVYAKDTPNFVANRLITFQVQWTMHEMTKAGLSIEEVDALLGANIGRASSAVFRTLDLVGLDTLQKVVANVRLGCPDDEQNALMAGPDWFDAMVEKGLHGMKTGSGFYKRTKEKDEKGKTIILGMDLETLDYRPPVKPRFDCTGAVRNAESLEDKLHIMLEGDDPGSQFAFHSFAALAQYAGNRIPEIADDIVNIDRAVKWGFAWKIGIFETWDALGFEKVCERMDGLGLELPPIAKAMQAAGVSAFYRVENGEEQFFDVASSSYLPVTQNPRELRLAELKREHPERLLIEEEEASLIDLGDGILCVEFHCKMNTIGAGVMGMLRQGLDRLQDDAYSGMIIANQGEHFSAGANLFMVLGAVMQEDWEQLEGMVHELQQVGMAMKYAPKPVVIAPHHYTFGGAVELSMHSDRCVLAGETYSGLVEAGVGIIPAGGGSKEMLVRALEYVPETVPQGDPFPYVRRAFETIAMAKVATSGPELVELGYLRPDCIIETNFEHQVQRAKEVCLGMAIAGYTPPEPPRLWALGESTRAAFKQAAWGLKEAGYASEHDVLIANWLGYILTGGDRLAGTPLTEQDVLELEKEAFVELCKTEKTQARIQHMLKTGKPLRN